MKYPVSDPVTLLKTRVNYWGLKLRVSPKILRVQSMKTKWGSCSTLGVLTLSKSLIEQDEFFQDVVIVHELLHLRLPSHNKLFKAWMTVYVPGWREICFG